MKNIKELKEVLNEKISNANEIVVVPHISPDFDALGSSVGIVNICNKLRKKSYILVNDNYSEMSSSVNEMIFEIKQQYDVINVKDFLNMKNKIDLMIATDVSKDYLIPIKEYLNYMKNIIIIDHHYEDNKTIKTKYKYIDTKISSTCEIVTKLLCQFGIRYDKNCANYLYAGIMLDTNKLSKSVSSDTFEIVSKLIKRGADINYINNLFMEIFENDRLIQNLVGKSNFQSYNFAITSDKDNFYTKEDLAKAADYMMKYSVDASFAIGYLKKDTVGISGRSNGKIDVGSILTKLNGGGNYLSGATNIENTNIEDVEKKLSLILKPGN